MTDFELWEKEVDRCIEVEVGLSSHDLPDKPYRRWYDEGMSPSDAAREALREEGFYP